MNDIDAAVLRDDFIALFQSEEFREGLREALANAISKSMVRPDPGTQSESELRSLLPLLKEYTRKFQKEYTQTDQQNPVSTKFGLRTTDVPEFQQRIVPIARKFAQFVSQRLNRAKDDLLRLELEFRLAEYEAALAKATRPH